MRTQNSSLQLSRRNFLRTTIQATSISVLLGLGCDPKRASTTHQLSMQSPWINDAEFIGYFVALDEKYYDAESISLNYKEGGPEVIAEGTVLSKQADLALAPIETVASLIVKENAPLRIIGAQYQKNPLGIVSLADSNIKAPQDLMDRTLAVPQANVLTAEALLKLNNVPIDRVKIVPYAYDPTPLIKRQVDATVDFVTNVPFTIKQANVEPSHFLLWDWGFKVYQDVVVVLEETLRTRREPLLGWLKASRRGWDENFRDPEKYPNRFIHSHFKSTGRTVANEIAFNKAQAPLIQTTNGIFSMTEPDIEANINTLSNIGLKLNRDVFVTDLLQQI
jgi:ABC-type nitrate/sulfonate/bicarbonate transport system substrate-binding protein